MNYTKIVFVTDNGAGEFVGEPAQVEIYSVPLQVSCDNKNYQDLEELGIGEIYALMKGGKMLSTSPPPLGRVEGLLQGLRQQSYDITFVVPICSRLSGTTSAVEMTAQQRGIVLDHVDCYIATVVQKCTIRLAKQLYEAGKSIEQIKEVLQCIVYTTSTILLPSDSQHLKRSGRLASLVAILGGLLKVEPTPKINEETGGKTDVLDKVRTMHRAMNHVTKIMRRRHVDDFYLITVAHVDDGAGVLMYVGKLKQALPNATYQIIKLVSMIGVHAGRGCQAVRYFKQIKE